MTASPVSAPIQRTLGRLCSRPLATAVSGSRAASIRAEWKACETRSRRTRLPRARKSSSSPSTACASPETTTDSGPFTAAIETPSTSPRAVSIASSLTPTAPMAPPSGRACMSRARLATSRAAPSRLSTPAAWAAAISPTEWPATASGVIPAAASSATRPTSTANRPVWAYSVWSARGSSAGLSTTSFTGTPSSASSTAQARSNASANTGEAAYSSRPIPAR
ncbi:hypothetical protein Kisp01_35910 [Kineosporia sp. NBRC 101677]|nr:hypothetical protein Kisp01_35910 [Kineosporia sp. NBRC 101677]